MRYEITESGANGHEVGSIVEIEGPLAGWLVGKARPLSGQERVAVTNPAEGATMDPMPASAQERQALLADLAMFIEATDFMDDGRPDVRAINAGLPEGQAKFTAAERDQLWPGVSADVMAARD